MDDTSVHLATNAISDSDQYLPRLRKVIGNLFDQLNPEVLEDLIHKLDWIDLGRGEILCHQGEAGESLYVLITGRLRAIVGFGKNQEREVGEISPGETVGEMAMITGEPRTATIVALRDSCLVRLLKSDFDAFIKLHPEVLLALSRLTINRLNYAMHHTRVPAQTTNIALIPASQSAATRQFIRQLTVALQQECNIQYLHKDLLPAKLAYELAAHDDKQEVLDEWLVSQEIEKDYVVYEAESKLSLWTKQCLKHADKIIVVKDVTEGTDLTNIEALLFQENGQYHLQSRELVVLYPEATAMPALTHTLLAQRTVKRHYNVRLNDNRHINRISRMIVDKGIGLVLGGGGAKGFAHFGIFRALHEASIPVDMVCGTSMGAIIAAAIASEWNPDEMLVKGRSAFVQDKPLNDYTLPIISLIKGHKLQKINRKYFGDFHIEDLWLNFFCISSNLTLSEMVIHERGPLWKAVTASVSIPGVLPPVVDGNNLLVDGASFNNFPVDIMKAKYGGTLIGVNLLADREYKLNYTNLPGGWHMLFSRFMPFLRRYKAPGIASIMLKSTILSSMMHQRNQVHDLDLFLSPPVSRYSLLDLNSFDRVVETGYKYCTEVLATLELEKLSKLKGHKQKLAAV